MNAGTYAFKLGLRGMPPKPRAASSSAIFVCHRAEGFPRASARGAHVHAAAIAAVRQARRNGLRVTCEVAPHHFLLTEEHVASTAPTRK